MRFGEGANLLPSETVQALCVHVLSAPAAETVHEATDVVHPGAGGIE
jgi:hypothetical protein